MIVSEKVAVCDSDPDVAVTVTVDVTGSDEVTTGEAPQPLSRPIPTTLTASSKSIGKRRRFFQPRQQSATARAEPGKSGLLFRWSAADAAAVVTVSAVDAGAPDGVTVAGKKLHVAPAGSPEVQLNETAELKPLSGVTVALTTICPGTTVSDARDVLTVKSGGGRLIV